MRLRGRPSLKDRMRAGLQAQKLYASGVADDDPRRAANQARLDSLSATLAPKRAKVRRPVDGRLADDLEDNVKKGVAALLNVHPKVLFAVRQNSGAMPYESGGRMIPVWFYKIVRTPGRMTIVDFWGFLADRRPFAFECKRPSWTGKTLDERELKQQTFLHMVRSLGGVGAFVTDPQQIVELIA